MVFNLGNKAVALVAAFALMLVLPPEAGAWGWPVEGQVLRPFSAESDPYSGGQHRGVDIAAPAGSPVRSPATGVVSFAGQLPNGGRCLTIRTADGYSVTLVHLGSIAVPVGTAIGEGEVVGTIGPSGEPEVPEPYVHLGVRLTADPNGYLDPLTLLPARRAQVPPPPVSMPPAPVPAMPAAVPAPAPARRAVAHAPARPSGARTGPAVRRPPLRARSGAAARGAEAPARGRDSTRPKRAQVSSRRPAPQVAGPSRVSPGSSRLRPAESTVTSRPPASAAAPPFRARRHAPAVVRPPRPARADTAAGGVPRHAVFAVLATVGVALVGLSALWRRRPPEAPVPAKFLRRPLRKMSPTEPAPEESLAEPPTSAHPDRSRLALRERATASRPCRGLRRALRHQRPLPPAARRSGADGQRHGRARNAGHGRRRSGGSVAA